MVDLVKARQKAKEEKQRREAEEKTAREAAQQSAADSVPPAPPEPPPPAAAEAAREEEAVELHEDFTTLEVVAAAPPMPDPSPAQAPEPPPSAPSPAVSPEMAMEQTLELKDEAAPAAESRCLTFRVGEGMFAIPIETIDEIIPFQRPSEMPNVPPTVAGVMSLRGRVVTVLDARLRLGYPAAAPTEESRIIVLRQAEGLYGLHVDAVGHVLGIPAAEVEDATAVVAVQRDYLLGVHYHKNDMVVLLRLESFLDVSLKEEVA